MAGYSDIRQVITMSQAEIDMLTYVDDSQNTVSVPVPARAYLQILKTYHAHQHEEGDSIGNNWTSITAEQFDEFRIVDYNVITLGSTTGYTSSRPAPASLSLAPHSCDPIANFKKGIKHDPTLFPPFKLEKQWVSWQ